MISKTSLLLSLAADNVIHEDGAQEFYIPTIEYVVQLRLGGSYTDPLTECYESLKELDVTEEEIARLLGLEQQQIEELTCLHPVSTTEKLPIIDWRVYVNALTETLLPWSLATYPVMFSELDSKPPLSMDSIPRLITNDIYDLVIGYNESFPHRSLVIDEEITRNLEYSELAPDDVDEVISIRCSDDPLKQIPCDIVPYYSYKDRELNWFAIIRGTDIIVDDIVTAWENGIGHSRYSKITNSILVRVAPEGHPEVPPFLDVNHKIYREWNGVGKLHPSLIREVYNIEEYRRHEDNIPVAKEAWMYPVLYHIGLFVEGFMIMEVGKLLVLHEKEIVEDTLNDQKKPYCNLQAYILEKYGGKKFKPDVKYIRDGKFVLQKLYNLSLLNSIKEEQIKTALKSLDVMNEMRRTYFHFKSTDEYGSEETERHYAQAMSELKRLWPFLMFILDTVNDT